MLGYPPCFSLWDPWVKSWPPCRQKDTAPHHTKVMVWKWIISEVFNLLLQSIEVQPHLRSRPFFVGTRSSKGTQQGYGQSWLQLNCPCKNHCADSFTGKPAIAPLSLQHCKVMWSGTASGALMIGVSYLVGVRLTQPLVHHLAICTHWRNSFLKNHNRLSNTPTKMGSRYPNTSSAVPNQTQLLFLNNKDQKAHVKRGV